MPCSPSAGTLHGIAEIFLKPLRRLTQGDFSLLRAVVTRIQSNRDLREAELAWDRLRETHPQGSLITAVDYYLENAGIMVRGGQANLVVEDYLERRLARGNQQRTVDVCRSILGHFLRSSGLKEIGRFNRQTAEDFMRHRSLDSEGNPRALAVRTTRNRFDQLHNFAEFLVQEKYLAQNFMSNIDRPKVTHDGVVNILGAEQVKELLQVASTYPVGRGRSAIDGAMLPYLAICALSGVRPRPDEAKRLGPDWEWFSKENRLITGFRAKNSKSPRTVEIHDELVEILEYSRKKEFSPSGFRVKVIGPEFVRHGCVLFSRLWV